MGDGPMKVPVCVICRTEVTTPLGDPEPTCADLELCRATIAEESLNRLGLPTELAHLAEECNELAALIAKRFRGKHIKDSDIQDEIADVLSCAAAVLPGLQTENFEDAARRKLKKFRAYIDSIAKVPA
jgi:NTP pyrophosphatase (non-canonical NTP hydrolase)